MTCDLRRLRCVAVFMAVFAFGTALTLGSLALEESTLRRYRRFSDLLRLFTLGVVENFGYRQLTNYRRILGVISAFRGVGDWGNMERRGFTEEK